MYKLLLCWRYLRTRYLAMVCIVSVMLGVATLIVVNSVMGGFSTKLRERLHGLLSDVVIETGDLNGFADPQGKMTLIRSDPELDAKIEAMTGTLETFAMLQYEYRGLPYTRPIRLIGIDPEARAKIGGFQEYLVNERHRNSPALAFELDDEALRRFLDNNRFTRPPTLEDEEVPPLPMSPGAQAEIPAFPDGLPNIEPGPARPKPASPPSQAHVARGAVIGYAIGNHRVPAMHPGDPPDELRSLNPGDEVVITTVSGAKLKPAYDRFVVSDYVKTEMSEYDSNYVYVPLDHLQHLRAMDNRVTAIQIKLKNYDDARFVVSRLRQMFPYPFQVNTWEEKQGPLLSAIRIEKGILNVLLFLIIAVAGFGILAIFSMIVVEKTRDIGILKALGASNGGVMKIFLAYGLLLGLVGATLGTALGLTITHNINGIEKFIAGVTGQEIFDRNIYYFDQIPTDISPWMVVFVNLGALGIAVLFSVLPALRAAMLHPVRALRFE
jgi:lipoprotein-releasing system permease protein